MDEFEHNTSMVWDPFGGVQMNFDFPAQNTPCNALTGLTTYNNTINPITFNSTDSDLIQSLQPRKISRAQWDKIKDVIHEQYIGQNCTLNDLVRCMEEEHSFIASKQQYVRKLKEWKFEKNRQNQDWSGIAHALKRRRLEVDAADVYLNGHLIPSKKLKKEISRWDRPSLQTKYLDQSILRGASPQTPDGFLIERHNAYSIQVFPPSHLPWFDFLDRLTTLSSALSPNTEVLTRQHALVSSTPSGRYSLLTRLFRSNETGSNICHQGNVVQLAAQLAKRLSIVLIERKSGDLEDAFNGNGNNSKSLGIMRAHDRDHELVEMFLQQLLNSEDPTTQVFTNYLFHHSVNEKDFWLLQQIAPRISDVDIKLPRPHYLPGSALRIAIDKSDLDAARFLLSSGSDPNQCLCEWGVFQRCQQENCVRPMDLAARDWELIELVNDLLDRGAEFNKKRILDSAIRCGADTHLIGRLVKAGSSLQASIELEWVQEFEGQAPVYRDPLTAAIISGRSDVVEQLIHEYHLTPNAQDALDWQIADEPDCCHDNKPLCFISPLICAIMLEEKDMIEFLLAAGADVDECVCQYVDLDSLAESCQVKRETLWTVCKSKLERDVFSPLQAAALTENNDLVQKLVNLGASLEPCHGTSALMHSVLAGNHTVTNFLLESGAGPDALGEGEYRVTPLMAAVTDDDVAMVELLLRHGAYVSLQGETFDAREILVRLYVSQCTERVRTLAKSNMKRHTAANGDPCRSIPISPPVEYADPSSIELSDSLSDCWSVPPEHFETVLKDPHGTNLLRVCLKGGSDPSGPIRGNDCSALELILDHVCTCHEGTGELLKRVSLLLHHGGKIGLTEFSKILTMKTDRWRGIMGQVLSLPDCLEDLLRAHIHQIHEAVTFSDAGVLQQIVPAALREMKKRNPAFKCSRALCHTLYARSFAGIALEETARALFENGFYINSLIDTGVHWMRCREKSDWDLMVTSTMMTPLTFLLHWQDERHQHQSICHMRLRVLRFLVEAGSDINRASVNSKAINNMTPLQLACYTGGCFDEVRCLVEAGADINAPAPSLPCARTALQGAAERGNLEVVEYLIFRGADANAPAGANRGATALQCAAGKGRFHVMQVLLEAGADINAPGAEEEGRTAIEIAAENGRLDCLYHLLDKYNGQTPISEVCEEAAEYAREEGHHAIADFLDRYAAERDTGQQCEI